MTQWKGHSSSDLIAFRWAIPAVSQGATALGIVETQQNGVRVRMNAPLLLARFQPAQAGGWMPRARSTPTARSVRGFSLIELLVVMAVTIILAGILMPALSGLRDQADRLISGSNMRQMGMSMSMYATDNFGRLPYSALLHAGDPSYLQEMMVTFVEPENYRDLQAALAGRGKDDAPETPTELTLGTHGFEGIGLLYGTGYVDAPNVFYCPAHHGDHPLERYARAYDRPTGILYGNYQYRGDIDIHDDNRALTLERDAARVFLTDGMRTKRDFNHRVGYNSLLGDGSVWWRSDVDGRIYRLLPDGKVTGREAENIYNHLWDIIDAIDANEREDES